MAFDQHAAPTSSDAEPGMAAVVGSNRRGNPPAPATPVEPFRAGAVAPRVDPPSAATASRSGIAEAGGSSPRAIRSRRGAAEPHRLGRPGLRGRMAIACGLVALLLSGILATLAYQQTRAQLLHDRQDSALSRAYINARLLRNSLRTSRPDVPTVLAAAAGNSGSVAIAKVDGQWFSDSVGIGSSEIPASLAEVVAGGDAGRQRVRVDGQLYVVAGVPLPASSASYFEFVPMSDIEASLQALRGQLALLAALTALIGAALGWYVSVAVLRPLRQMASAAEDIAGGSADTRLAPTGDHDLWRFVDAFNRMADAVQERLDREVRFTSDVAHELRSPVAAMLAAVAVARRQAAEQPGTDEVLGELEGRVMSFHLLLDDLMEISRADAGMARLDAEEVDVGRLVVAALDTMGRGSVPVVVDADVPNPIVADKRRLGQMVMNLVTNADRYAGGASRVHVERAGACVRIAVEDHGPGVPDHERTYIFERFARGAGAASVEGGSGLGLSLVAEHARLHGGRVGLEEPADGGSRFVIELPVAGPAT